MADDKTTAKSKADATTRPGFSREGKAYPGVDPESGERKAVTLEGLKKEFGPKSGAEIYRRIAVEGGFGIVEGSPDLSLVGLEGEHKKKVDEILANAEKE